MTNHKLLDETYMRRCLQLARCGQMNAKPNPMVGAVIVSSEGRIIGEGYHVRCGEGHAEVNAFASVRADDEPLLTEATMYVSLEPCSHYGKTPPCADLIVRKGVKRVVVGCIDEFAKVQGRGIEKLRQAGIEVTVGVLEDECRWLNRRFFTYHREHRPYIILKWAQTADGFIDRGGQPLAISTPLTTMLVHQLRAEEDAIVVGRMTFCREHPQLNVRHWAGHSPARFLLTSNPSSILHSDTTDNWQVATTVKDLLQKCHEQQLQSLIVEGGRKTLQSFLDRGIWDEIRVETGKLSIGENTGESFPASTAAPVVPADAVRYRTEYFDGNRIDYFRPKSAGTSPQRAVSHFTTGF